MSNKIICCFDYPNNIFKVEIEDDELVSDLKEEIKEKTPNVFANLSVDRLWEDNIPLDENDKLNVIKKFKSKESDITERVVEYFSNNPPDKNTQIIIKREQINVALFGLTGHGKSSIANMLIQGDIYQEKNEFEVNDGAKGGTINIKGSTNEVFQVYDTIGLGEPSTGSVSNQKAEKDIRNYFSICEVPLNYIFYVKKKGRFTDEDVKMFKTFKRIFEGGEENIIIIITHSNPGWVKRNLETIKENFGDYPIIPVDFPWSDEEDDNDAQYHQKKRAQSLQHLLNKLFTLKRESIKLEVLSSSQKIENNVAKVVEYIPLVGSTYQLISAGVYCKLGKPKMVKQRFISGAVGLVFDITFVATAGTSIGLIFAGKAAETIAGKEVVKALCKSAGKAAGKALGKAYFL